MNNLFFKKHSKALGLALVVLGFICLGFQMANPKESSFLYLYLGASTVFSGLFFYNKSHMLNSSVQKSDSNEIYNYLQKRGVRCAVEACHEFPDLHLTRIWLSPNIEALICTLRTDGILVRYVGITQEESVVDANGDPFSLAYDKIMSRITKTTGAMPFIWVPAEENTVALSRKLQNGVVLVKASVIEISESLMLYK